MKRAFLLLSRLVTFTLSFSEKVPEDSTAERQLQNAVAIYNRDTDGTAPIYNGVEYLYYTTKMDGDPFFLLTNLSSGWVSYTYSRSLIRQYDPLAGEIINGGNFYPSNFDQPHSATMIGNYRITHRFSVSLNATYSTGRPITLPVGVFDYAGSERLLYSQRNQYRIPDYFRTDFSVNMDGNHEIHQWPHNSWTFGVYNLQGRKNAYSVYYVSQDGGIQGYRLYIFGNAIPFLTYNIRF